MTDRSTHLSSRLIFPVASPWALDRRGNAVAYLSVRQRALLLYLTRTHKTGGRRTLARMAQILEVTSRGQVSRELRRLRQLELISYKARRGPRGWHQIWPNRRALKLRSVQHALSGVNDSASVPHGRFISRKGLEDAWRKRRRPPDAGLASARDGPRRGNGPPRTLNARCPVGHPTRLGRRSWTVMPGGGLEAAFHGVCRRCGGREISEIVSVLAPAPPPRTMSAAETADPGLVAARLRMAELFARDGVQLATVREYRDMAQRSAPAAGPVNPVVHQVIAGMTRVGPQDSPRLKRPVEK